MEGKRFGVGLAAGLLVGLALVVVSGGLGAGPLAQFSLQNGPAGTTAASSASTLSVTSATTPTVTYTVATTTTNGGLTPSQSSNGTRVYTSTSTTTFSTTLTFASSTTSGSPSGQNAATNANGGITNGFPTSSGNHNPTYLENITQQPIVSNAEILAPVLVAFLLGAFLYRVTVREREKSDAEA